MRIYLQVLDYEIWKVVCDGPFIPIIKNGKREDIKNFLINGLNKKRKKMSLSSKVMNVLFCSLDKKEFHGVSSCESAQEICNKLEVVYEGTN